MKRKFLAALLAALLTLSLAACEGSGDGGGTGEIPATPTGTDGGKVDNPTQTGSGGGTGEIQTSQNVSNDFQKNMHQSRAGNIASICETETGYYFQYDGMFYTGALFYIDKGTNRATILCGKPDCDHMGDDCNSKANAFSLWCNGERLYYAYSDGKTENGKFVYLGKYVRSLGLDGTGRREVQNLELTQVSSVTLSSSDRPIYHRGNVYFTFNCVLYSMPLEGDIQDAKRIWGEDYSDGTSSGGMAMYDPDMPRFELWADGETVYFMVNQKQSNGTSKNMLFSYAVETGEVKKVWETPEAAEVGNWETTGVKVSQWYVTNGCIYFYLSGGDFWRSDLESGETVKLADTHNKTLYGTATFSDHYMCLMNNSPLPNPANGEYFWGSTLRTGGDTIFVYDLDGNLVTELSLESLNSEIGEISACDIVFCSGNSIYFTVDAGKMSPPVNGLSTKINNEFLYCISIETGEITQIYNWK